MILTWIVNSFYLACAIVILMALVEVDPFLIWEYFSTARPSP